MPISTWMNSKGIMLNEKKKKKANLKIIHMGIIPFIPHP